MDIDSEEVSTYITALVKGVEKGIPVGYFPSAPIKIEIGVSNVGTKEGSIKLMVVGVGGDLKKEQHAKVQIELISPLTEETKKVWESWVKRLTNPPASWPP